MNHESLIDNLLTYYSTGEQEKEVVTAKAEFFDHVGVMDEESYDYDMKMTQFSEWFLFSRKLPGKGVTPLVQAREHWNGAKEYPELYESLLNHRHSLFEFLKVAKSDLHIRDLISNYKFVVKDSPVTIGFNKSEYFEARLLPKGDSFIFTRAFCFHPPLANKFIKKEIKLLSKIKDGALHQAREDLLLKLFKMKNKVEQYRHVSIQAVYKDTD